MNMTCKKFKKLVVLCFLMTSMSSIAHGDQVFFPSAKSSVELERIKSLEGKWSTVTSMFSTKNQRMYTEYEVTANGSAVLERIFPGTAHEMLSVYYDDNRGKLAMTHYCILQNRPTFKLAKSTDSMISLHVAKIEGPKTDHNENMGNMDIIFKDKNHMTQVCHDKKTGEAMSMEFTRVR